MNFLIASMMMDQFPTPGKKTTSEQPADQEISDGSANAFEGTETLREEDDQNLSKEEREALKKQAAKDDGSAY